MENLDNELIIEIDLDDLLCDLETTQEQTPQEIQTKEESTMLEFENEEKVIELIKKSSIDNSDKDAQRLIYKLKNMHEELHPYIKAWVNGEEPDFEYHGITINEIRKTQHYNYFLALYEMNTIINNPNPEARIEHIRNRFMDTVGSTKKKG